MAGREGPGMRGVYCTIVARNYLPQALALYESVRQNEPGRDFYVLLVDGPANNVDTSARPGFHLVGMEFLGLSYRQVLDLAAIYDVVELSTAVKPLLLKNLLRKYEQAVYLDPDTFVISPLAELEALIDEYDIVLTPHLLEPIPPGETFRSEVNSLTVGVHNLGFCAVGRGGVAFLDWWWSHLERECLIYPLLGLFVDQKWVDVGSVIFSAFSLRHYGYNIAHWNLHERSIESNDSGYVMATTGEPLRLLHFSGFDPRDPDAISARQNISLKDTDLGSKAYSELSREYAALVIDFERELGPRPQYRFDADLNGRPLTKRLRRTFRRALVSSGADPLPSPFIDEDRASFARWRRRSLSLQAAGAAGDAAIGLKYAFPDIYNWSKSRLPGSFSQIREYLLRQGQIRR